MNEYNSHDKAGFTIVIPPEICFLIECIFALSRVTDGFNSIAEVLAQEVYPFEDLL